jgi:hypothetical protein
MADCDGRGSIVHVVGAMETPPARGGARSKKAEDKWSTLPALLNNLMIVKRSVKSNRD